MPPRNFVTFWLTTFLGAFLLFLVQPMIAKIILPWFGGSAAVWTACMMFFQVMLVLGYGYAHTTERYLSRNHAFYLHAFLLVAACCCLPIIPNQSLQPTPSTNVNLAVSVTLLLTVGLPYFVLASNSTLVQIWHQAVNAPNESSGGAADRSTYRLYAVSNLGSMSALLFYPFFIEPVATLTAQAWLWSVAFIAFAVLSLVTAWPTRLVANKNWKTESYVVGPSKIAIWFLLSSIASVVLLATTNLMCQEIASVPFLWILPLAVYLASFIICFQSPRLYHRGVFVTLLCVFVVLGIAVVQAHIYLSILIQIAVMTGVCFFVAMVCHGELVRTKPPATRLTTFYLTLSIGGAAGGIFTAVIAPRIFDGFHEFQLALLAAFAIVLFQILRSPNQRPDSTLDSVSPSNPSVTWTGKVSATIIIGLAAAITLSSYMLQTNSRLQNNIVMRSRNEYGVMMVKQNDTYRRFVSGNVDHGGQFIDPHKSFLPSGYYTSDSGVGIAFRSIREFRTDAQSTSDKTTALPSPATERPDHRVSPDHDAPLDVAVIGMGIGAMLAWCELDDQFTLYELNPAVHDIANEHFTYLRHFAQQVRVLIGDGRLLLSSDTENGGVRKFDLIFVDAFSSDAIPQHLLTSQCVDEYLEHLNDDGILIFHITNRFVDLRPVIANLADEKNLYSYLRENRNSPADRGTRWVLLCRQRSVLDADWMKALRSDWPRNMPAIRWTDDFAPLSPVTIWNAAIDVEALRSSQSEIDTQNDVQNDVQNEGHSKPKFDTVPKLNTVPKIESSLQLQRPTKPSSRFPSTPNGVSDE